MTAKQTFRAWTREVRKEVKRLEQAGRLKEAAWLAQSHSKQVVTIFGSTL